jgi:hypothetical protein
LGEAHVHIEEPDNQGSTTGTVIEDPDGIVCTAEKDTVTVNIAP